MSELTAMANIGQKLEAQLIEIGITTPDQLVATGSREAWLRIKAIDPSACLMRLSALEGAIQGLRWHHLDDTTKAQLKAFYHSHK